MISLAPWLAAAAGLLFGSFLNVCISRLPQHRSIAQPPSHCPRCAAPIRSWDNIPLLSFLLLRGRCRACRQPISPRYPLVEAALAILWGLSFATFPVTHGAIRWVPFEAAVFCFLALGLFVTDAETLLLPDTLTLPGIVLGFASGALPGTSLPQALHLLAHAPFSVPQVGPFVSSLIGAAAAACALLLVRWAYWLLRRREGMGLGDIKLAAMLGAWLGTAGAILTLVLGILLAAMLALLILLLRRSAPEDARQMRLPFGSALCAGAFGTLFYGAPILTWYFHFFV